MSAPWEQVLLKWQNAGFIDSDAAARIREFELRESGKAGLRWPAIAAIAFGGIMLAAGVLLFVSAHWDDIAPSTRFITVVTMVALFHLGGAFTAPRFEALAMALHGIGTVALGAGIYLCGQIFNMAEHWPSAILMWAVGAWIGWGLRRDWVQLACAGILTPAWVGSEWVASHSLSDELSGIILIQGLLLLSITYFTARPKVLVWIGGITLLPCTILSFFLYQNVSKAPQGGGSVRGYLMAYALPLLLGLLLRGRHAWILLFAAGWVRGIAVISHSANNPTIYLWCGIGAVGMVAWGLHEHRSERVNLGMVGFAITILCFYFSAVMDKLGRSASLIGLGILFLAGGWALEQLRRRLVARI